MAEMRKGGARAAEKKRKEEEEEALAKEEAELKPYALYEIITAVRLYFGGTQEEQVDSKP